MRDFATNRAVAVESIVSFAQTLVRIPSQGGIDSCEQILRTIHDWLTARRVSSTFLHDDAGRPVGLISDVSRGGAGPTYCLNACVDTAPFGDLAAWRQPPTSAAIIDGWLHGRGSADCKMAVSIFSHLAVEFWGADGEGDATLSILFDADEHTGTFSGIRTYLSSRPTLTGVMIGYPGNYGVVTGARGFCRTRLTTYATSAHSGSARLGHANAVLKAARLAERLAAATLPTEGDPAFPFGPKLSVTGIRGGNGYSVTPDQCEVHVDIRLTPSFGSDAAVDFVQRVIDQVDAEYPTWKATALEITETWPAYKLTDQSLLVSSLRSAASRWTGRDVPAVTCGPSNVGNYLASLGVEATCGYGVTYKNLHAPNECVDLTTIDLVYRVYREAIGRLLGIAAAIEQPAPAER